ncbi:alpha/beta hydrolase [Haloechinothrix sp. YIM 98757]|uniref:Alpha/beta hydrolase n=1 Tax=Haloechinothrix aidingensis TaxID=2752311 RepID=A0A838ABV9_9PSEU|nr:alpha/beta hydrolase [Haloechinothrix aidingensis]
MTLVCEISGPSDGQPVILLHGAGQTRSSWSDTVAALTHCGFCTVAVDLRGHGESGWAPDGDYSMDALVDDVRAVASQFDKPAMLVGASMGGLAALAAAGEHPAVDCVALVLVDVTPRISIAGSQRIIEFMRTGIEGWPSLEVAARAISRFLPSSSQNRGSERLLKNLRKCDDGYWRWHWDPAFLDPESLHLTRGTPERFESAAGNVSNPVLLIRGGSSELVDENDAREFFRVVPHAQYVEIDNATHAVTEDKRQIATRSIIKFLSRIGSPSRSDSY